MKFSKAFPESFSKMSSFLFVLFYFVLVLGIELSG